MANTIPKVNGVSHARDRSEDSTPLENLLAVSTIVLRQAVEFLEENITADDQLSYRSKYMPGSTIGKHLRHARDHFVLLAESVSSPDAATSPSSIPALSYDTRARNTPMETSREAAIDALNDCIEQLRVVVPLVSMDQPVTLSAITPHVQVFHTSFGRELWFAALHAVHHWSMVRVIAGELNIQLEDSFGVAPSTLVFHGTEAVLGKSKAKI